MWSLDDWKYVAREVATDPSGRSWTVALMDVLGQEGDPDMPNEWLELQYAAGRYVTLIYAPTGGIQWERAYPQLPDATREFERLRAAVEDGSLDPAQPVFREDLDE